MQEFIDYNFLIIGRSGSGKSATSKLLTGDPSITVANSLNQVTKSVNFYQGISHLIDGQQIRFGILDIPGLDKIDNRFKLREIILQELQRLKINIHGIIYVASLTQRDTVNRDKLFQFLQHLPWKPDLKKSVVIPILTKYDNFLIDAPEQDIQKTKKQFQEMFQEKGYNQAWSRHIFWVNFTKSLDFKMKYHQDIRDAYENQIEKLAEIMKKNRKNFLSIDNLKEYIRNQEKFILDRFSHQLKKDEIPFHIIKKSHQISLHIKLEPKKLGESFTRVSASSIGIILSRALKADIPTEISMAMAIIPVSLTIINMMSKQSTHISDKISLQKSDCQIMNQYNQICQKINDKLENQWVLLNKVMDFYLEDGYLVCKICKKAIPDFDFFHISEIQLTEVCFSSPMKMKKEKEDESVYLYHEVESPSCKSRKFSKKECQKYWQFWLPVPLVKCEVVWEPVIEVNYKVKAFEEITMIQCIDRYRSEYSKL